MKHTKRQVCFGIRVLVSFLFVLLTTYAYGQAVYGSLFGTVADPSGAIVPGAQVTVTSVERGTTYATQTNSDGFWRVGNLIPGTYSVAVTAGTFATGEVRSIELNAGVSQQVVITLQPQGSRQVVTVTSEVPALKTDRAEISEIMNERSIAQLPNLTRNFTQIALLTPGMQRSTFNILGPENPQGGIAMNSNGSNYGVQGFVLDGTDNREPVLGIIVINPTLDSISEMKVTTQNYEAEYGGAVGGIISASTKSGGNALHGDVFWYRHSNAQQARDPFAQSARDPITNRYLPGALYNQFGGAVGGPIIPNKAFFFLDYQATRQRLGTSLRQSVPTLEVRNTCLAAGSATCDLSEYVTSGNIYYRATPGGPATAYAPNAVPTSLLSPQALFFLRELPPPNTAGPSPTVGNFVASGNGISNADQPAVRFDYHIGARMNAFGRYNYALYRLTGAPAFGVAGGAGFGITNTTGTSNVQNQSATVGLDWALRNTLLTEIRVGFMSYHVSENKYTLDTPATDADIPNLNTLPDTAGLPSFNITDGSISNFGNQNCNCPLRESEQVFQFVNNWTWVRGRHAIKFGADIRYAKNLRNASDNNRTGVLNFNNGATQAPLGEDGAGSGFASLLFGQVNEFQRFNVYLEDASNRQKRFGFFGQDSWRVRRNLTVNYGVRWDMIYPETVNAAGRGGFASLVSGGTRVAGVAGIGTNGGQKMDYTFLAGRLGFAWQIYPDTVLRGGVGQVYDDVGFFGTLFGSVLTHNLPVLANEDINAGNVIGDYITTLSAPPVRPPAPFVPSDGIIPLSDNFGPQFRPERIQLPSVYQWNLTLQQQFGGSTTMEIAYVANRIEKSYPGETYGYDLNTPVLASTPAELASGNYAQRRPYYQHFIAPYNGGINVCCSNGMTSTFPAGNGWYNALQTKLDKRFSHGLQFNANYVWSRAINYANDNVFARYPRASRGPNDTNRNNVFVMSGIYQLPFGKDRMYGAHSSRWMDYLIGGYTVSGASSWLSGAPFTPTFSGCGLQQDLDTNFNGPGRSSDCRPDKGTGFRVHAGSFDPATLSVRLFTPMSAPVGTPGQFAFLSPAFATFGNVGRNSFRGPNQFTFDAALLKDIPFTERVKGQFQFQVFNLFNHPALDIPNASGARCVDCATGGVITNIDPNIPMRQLQFALRVAF
ncbi:MAG: TonB-dependent receptor [Acidobacteriaceae bacterium]|nr:TonB-dependent receptor [Acidobacteriaceae bacterium]